MGLNAAARHEFAAARSFGSVDAPEITVELGGKTLVLLDSDVLPKLVVAPPIPDLRFAGALGDDGTRAVPLPLVSTACLRCDKGREPCFCFEDRFACDFCKRTRLNPCASCDGNLVLFRGVTRSRCCPSPELVLERHVRPWDDCLHRCKRCGLASFDRDGLLLVACECGFIGCDCA